MSTVRTPESRGSRHASTSESDASGGRQTASQRDRAARRLRQRGARARSAQALQAARDKASLLEVSVARLARSRAGSPAPHLFDGLRLQLLAHGQACEDFLCSALAALDSCACVRSNSGHVEAEAFDISSIGGEDEEAAMTPPSVLALSELLPSPPTTSAAPTTPTRSTISQTTTSFPADGITGIALDPSDAALAGLIGIAIEALQSHRGVEERVSTLLHDLPADEGENASALIHVPEDFGESHFDEKIAAAHCSEVRDLLTSALQAIETLQEPTEDVTTPSLADSSTFATDINDCGTEDAASFASSTSEAQHALTVSDGPSCTPVALCKGLIWPSGTPCSNPVASNNPYSSFCTACVNI